MKNRAIIVLAALMVSATIPAFAQQESQEQVILVYARDGRAATLVEGDLDFACLGSRMQPSSTGNMVAIGQVLRERAKGAFYDERLVRLGRRALPFVTDAVWRSQTPSVTTTHTDTVGSLDTLAVVLRQAVAEGLLP